MQNKADDRMMQQAIMLAKYAETQGEVPVGAVLTLGNEIIAEGWNHSMGSVDPTGHAEIMTLREGAKKINNYRLLETALYVTLEPCVMCIGAMVHARIKRLVFGAYDLKSGAVGSVCNIIDDVTLNHKVEYVGGVLADDCGCLLTEFFQKRRKKRGEKIE